jgi:flagellar biosynthesis protein FlhB
MTVPLATVVLCGLRNATVAIRLEGRRSGRVVAMGMGATGSDIRTTADRAGVPCIDAPALAGELMVKTRPNALLPATMIDRIHDTREGADANG